MQAPTNYYIHVFADPTTTSGLDAEGVLGSLADAVSCLITEDGELAAGYRHTLHVYSAGTAPCLLASEILDLSTDAQRTIAAEDEVAA
jgi:hypothetical protein